MYVKVKGKFKTKNYITLKRVTTSMRVAIRTQFNKKKEK
jgi:hypothetical protein